MMRQIPIILGVLALIGLTVAEARMSGRFEGSSMTEEQFTSLLKNVPLEIGDWKGTDVNNPDPKLRARPVQGMAILTGFKPDAKGLAGGRIYDPKSGRTYRSMLRLNPDGSLKVSGCIAFICQSQRWTRAR